MAGSILETFYILFQSDAGDVKDGAEEAAGASGKLEKKLKETDAQAKKAGDSFGSLAKRAVAALTPIIGLAALKHTALNFAAGALAADDLSRSLGVGIESLQAWQGAAERVGGDASGLASSMKSLNDKMLEMRRTGGGEAAGVFYALGVSIRDSEGKFKTADTMLLSLADKFQGLSRERAMRLGEKLGLDEGTITLLQKGKKGVEELIVRQKELGLYSKRDAEESRKFNNALADLFQAFNAVAAVAMRVLLPVFTGISEGVTQAALNVRKHQNLVTGFFVALSVVMGILAIKTGVAFAPFFALAFIILAVAGAFAILYDDVVNFMEGNDSLIGKISKQYPQVGELVRDIVAAFRTLWDIAKAVGTLLIESIENPQKAWQKFQETVGPLIDAFTEKFPLLGTAIKDVGTIIAWLFDLAMPILKALGGLVWDILGVILDAVGKIGGLLAKAMSWVAGKIRGEVTVETPEGAASPASASPMPGEVSPEVAANIAASRAAIAQTGTPLASSSGAVAAGGKEINNTTSINIGAVQVQTQATDADGMAAGAADALAAQLQAAAENFDDGVAA